LWARFAHGDLLVLGERRLRLVDAGERGLGVSLVRDGKLVLLGPVVGLTDHGGVAPPDTRRDGNAVLASLGVAVVVLVLFAVRGVSVQLGLLLLFLFRQVLADIGVDAVEHPLEVLARVGAGVDLLSVKETHEVVAHLLGHVMAWQLSTSVTAASLVRSAW